MVETFIPKFITLELALAEFVLATATQDQQHIKPLHKYLSLRLVLEGGFRPEDITPRPPLRIESMSGSHNLIFDPAVEDEREQIVLGGLKTKKIDIVVCKAEIGPVMAVSVKGTGNAFRNLTNRMEEAIGDSTNVHIMYPGLVYGFIHFLKANREGGSYINRNDISIDAQGLPVSAVKRYHDVLLGLTGRRFVRNDYTRYEAAAIAMVESGGGSKNMLFSGFPTPESPLFILNFFDKLYSIYDLRFPYIAESVKKLRRLTWKKTSPAIIALQNNKMALDFIPRID